MLEVSMLREKKKEVLCKRLMKMFNLLHGSKIFNPLSYLKENTYPICLIQRNLWEMDNYSTPAPVIFGQTRKNQKL